MCTDTGMHACNQSLCTTALARIIVHFKIGAVQDDDDDDVAVIAGLEAARLSTPSAGGSSQVIIQVSNPQLLHTTSAS